MENFFQERVKRTVAREKKRAKFLNVYMDEDIFNEFEEFCKTYGYTKTAVVELAVSKYMSYVKDKMKGGVLSDGTDGTNSIGQ